jgi:potassium-transporting ATPase KdpC subunit
MKQLRTAIVVLVFWTVILGGIYPLLAAGIGAVFFPAKAAGSLVFRGGKAAGSELIGQDFTGPGYFHPRPSAVGYDASVSGASNQGWSSRALKEAVERRRAGWDRENAPAQAPMDMLFASGSGLDPHISPQAAQGQAGRVASARALGAREMIRLNALVRRFTEEPQLGFLGEPRVNVLLLNLALDSELPPAAGQPRDGSR